jgi:hypothetical protein
VWLKYPQSQCVFQPFTHFGNRTLPNRLLKKGCFGKKTFEFPREFACFFDEEGLFQQPANRDAKSIAKSFLHGKNASCIHDC